MRYGSQKTFDFYEIQRSHTASLSKKYERIFVYIFWRVKVPEMNVSDHDLSESFGIFEKSFLVVEISCCEYRKILDFPTFSRIWRSLICRQLQLCRRPPHMMDSQKKKRFPIFWRIFRAKWCQTCIFKSFLNLSKPRVR